MAQHSVKPNMGPCSAQGPVWLRRSHTHEAIPASKSISAAAMEY